MGRASLKRRRWMCAPASSVHGGVAQPAVCRFHAI